MISAVSAWQQADRSRVGARDELRAYLDAPLEMTKDVVAWWGVSEVQQPMSYITDHSQKHSTQYPVLARMARDYLAIQGSATLSERTFSNASLTDTKQRNRLLPDTFEALQILKSAYRNGHISATVEANSYYQTLMNVPGGEEGTSESTVLEIL